MTDWQMRDLFHSKEKILSSKNRHVMEWDLGGLHLIYILNVCCCFFVVVY